MRNTNGCGFEGARRSCWRFNNFLVVAAVDETPDTRNSAGFCFDTANDGRAWFICCCTRRILLLGVLNNRVDEDTVRWLTLGRLLYEVSFNVCEETRSRGRLSLLLSSAMEQSGIELDA